MDSPNTSIGTASTTYISIPDPTATSTTIGNSCTGLGLPSLPAGWAYHCSASSTYRNVDGTGWIPVNFSSLSFGSPLGALPADPINNGSSTYYTYTAGGSWQLTATPESNKVRTTQANQTTGAITAGSNLNLSPLFNPNGLVGYWKFDEGQGTSTLDSSGNGNTGTWSGTAIGDNGTYYVQGKVGSYAGTFTGTCSTIVNVSNSFHPTNAISVTAWVKKAAGSANSGSVVVRSSNDYFFDFANSPTSLRFGFNGNWGMSASGYPDNGNWHFVSGTYDSSIAKLYVDGISIGSASYSTSSIMNSGQAMAMGGYIIGCPNYNSLNGSLDDVRIYNRVLSAAEIMALYNATK